MAHVFDIKMQAHIAATPIGQAAALQLEAAVANFYIHEHYGLAQIPECREYGKESYLPKNGYITVPDVPGLGQELSEKAICEAVWHRVES